MERENFLQPQQGKILRAPSLKRGRPEERITDRIKLEKVLGVTVSSNAALTSDSTSEIVAYPAGCTVVLLSTKTAQQTHIINQSKKTVTSLAYSQCGRYLVTGECGHQPAVRVWDLQGEVQSGPGGAPPQTPQIAEYLAHKYGVNCVAFSPNGKYVVSIGSQHDMIVNVWDWKNNIKIASNKVSTKVKAVAFAENGSYFVTVGNRHVKFWYLEHGRAKYKEAVPLMGRSAILGEQRNNYFCDVACGKSDCGDSTYAITRSGLLCEFNNRRLLDKWVELRTTSANCMAVGDKYIFVGCAEGIVRCFDPSTLHFVTTLPRTHYLGVDVSQGLNISHISSQPPNAKYPDAIAVTYDEINNKLTVVYNDHSIYVWAVKDVKRVGKSHSFLYHSACIWGVENSPPASPLPPNSFLTCSSDDTVRVWTLDKLPDPVQQKSSVYQKNIYSNELLKVVYVDNDLKYLKDLDLSVSGTNEKDTSYDSRNGVRCIRLSADGIHLASGDRAGNVRIHETNTMTEICKVEAHDAEVLCLEYSNSETEHKMLASASRDRLIHVFDVNHGYNLLQTLDDHSSSITAVRFMSGPSNNLQMVSCGADKSIIFRQLNGTPNGTPQFTRGNNAIGKSTLYDMEVDTGQKHVLTACQDRNVRIYSVQSGKHTKTFKGSSGDDGSLIKVVLDRSGIYVATSCTDKSLSVYDYYSGECMATMSGHSELATGLRFTNDCRRLISASGDGCIFVWKIPHDMIVTMQARLSQQAMRQGKSLDNEIFSDGPSMDFYDPNANSVDTDYRFNVTALPSWAKKQMTDDTSPPVSLTRNVDFPKGRWAQRAEKTIGVKSVYSDSVISFPSLQDRKADSDGSKDSSIDSGTESRTESRMFSESRTEMSSIKVNEGFSICQESLKELLSTSKQSSASTVTISRGDRRTLLTDDSALESLRDQDLESTAHDGDIEDISDQENRTIQTLYYTSQQDSASGSEFPVNAMDMEELRRSQRKQKRPNLPLVSVTTASISGSQDSEDDDDEASTPSGEATDRNPMSMFSVSSESLDQIVNREKYLQSTFESLSGNELDTSVGGKTSISSQHHTRNGTPLQLRNMAVINAAKQIKSDPEATKKREELNKRIEETRRKLQSVGYRSNLKSSQSISDLSNVPERDNWTNPSSSTSRQQQKGAHNQICLQSFSYSQHPNYTNTNTNTIANSCTNVVGYTTNNLALGVDTNLVTSHVSGAYVGSNATNACATMPQSASVPNDLQLCGCFLQDIAKNTTFTTARPPPPSNHPYAPAPYQQGHTLSVERPRRLKLGDKFKLHKSLPVSPVSEELCFSDFARASHPQKPEPRRSFSYFIDLDPSDIDKPSTTEDSLRQVCNDIQRFSQEFKEDFDFKVKPGPSEIGQNEEEEEEANFSSDSLEECSFSSTQNKKTRKKYSLPRRCYSNNEIYDIYQSEAQEDNDILYTYNKEYHQIMPKSHTHTQSFYLNTSNRNSRESLLSDDYQYQQYYTKSYCNSMESILSDESECKSAPLEVLFIDHKRKAMPTSHSSPVHLIRDVYTNYSSSSSHQTQVAQDIPSTGISATPRTPTPNIRRQPELRSNSLTATDLTKENLENMSPKSPTFKVKKSNSSSLEFQQKLLKFETGLANLEAAPKVAPAPKRQSIAFFVETPVSSVASKPTPPKNNMTMEIPSLKSKNLQYKSKYCNILNNRSEMRTDIYGEPSGVCRPNANANAPNTTKPVFQSKENFMKSNTLEPTKLEKSPKPSMLQTTSLDRHILSKSLLCDAEKIAHKPPKAVRRHSSKNYSKSRKKLQNNFSLVDTKTHKTAVNFDRNIVRKADDHQEFSDQIESVIEINFKEKNLEIQCESSSTHSNSNSNSKTILTDIYDSLDKLILDSKIDQDSLECVVQQEQRTENIDFWAKSSKDLREIEQKNVWKKYSDFEKITSEKSQANLCKTKNTNILPNPNSNPNSECSRKEPILNLSNTELDKIQSSIESIKVLHEIQQKVYKINLLVDTFRANMSKGKVRILSKMYETLSKSQTGLNNFTEIAANARKYKRRNLSLPNFAERNLSHFEPATQRVDQKQLNLVEMSPAISQIGKQQDTAKIENKTEDIKQFIKEDLERRMCDKAAAAAKVWKFGSKIRCNLLPNRFEVHLNTETESNLRRACSLSDLSIPGAYKPKLQVSGKINQNKPTVPARTNLRSAKGSTMTRSSSTGVLNQSDSDQETPKASVRNSLMRPTISSQNKVSSSTKSNLVRRRIPQSLSTMNLSTVGQEDSSSEEASSNVIGSKPIVPPRPRSIMGDNLTQPVIVPRRHTAAQKDKLKTNRHTTETDVNIKTAQISSQLCHQIAEDLSSAADNVISLYKRLSDPSANQIDNLPTSQRQNLAKILENSVHKNLQILQEIFAAKQNGASQNGGHFDSPTTETIKKLNELSTQELSLSGDQTNVVNFMHQYSDILLNIMQQKMSSVKK